MSEWTGDELGRTGASAGREKYVRYSGNVEPMVCPEARVTTIELVLRSPSSQPKRPRLPPAVPTEKENDMQITRNTTETAPGPSEWFTGAVYIDTVATPTEPSRLGAASVHFTPGARTAWHTHPLGQTIYVTEGVASASGAAERSR